MFELILIERESKANVSCMSMISVADSDVDSYVEGLTKDENACIEHGVLLSYTLTAVYIPDNEVPLNYSPASIMEVEL